MFPTKSIKEYILRNEGRMPLPRRLTFEPTLACNLTCKMCDRFEKPTNDNINHLSTEDIRELVSKIPSCVKEVFIVGGEPFLRSDLETICEIFLSRNINVSLQTNGTFTERVLSLSGMKNVAMMFSLDGPAEIHDLIRGQKRVHERNMRIFDYYNEADKKINITSVLTKDNINSLSTMVSELAHLKNVHITFAFCRKYDKLTVAQSTGILAIEDAQIPMHLSEDVLTEYSYGEFEANLKKLCIQLDESGFSYSFQPEILAKYPFEHYSRQTRSTMDLFCGHLFDARIDRKGNLIHCHVIRKSFGNVFEKPFSELWNSKEIREFRVKLLKNNLVPVCENCYRCSDNSKMHLRKKVELSMYNSFNS